MMEEIIGPERAQKETKLDWFEHKEIWDCFVVAFLLLM